MKVGIEELRAHLDEYVEAAHKGEEIIIQDAETPVARLAPIAPIQDVYEKMGVIRATRTGADITKMLQDNPRGPTLPREELDRILAEDKMDYWDKWIAGELT